MTEEHVKKILTMLKANYPQSFSKLTPEMGEILLATWSIALRPYDDNKVNAAVITWICRHDGAFAPTVGQICSRIVKTPIYMYARFYPELFVGDGALPIGSAKTVQSLTGYTEAQIEAPNNPKAEEIAEVKALQAKMKARKTE